MNDKFFELNDEKVNNSISKILLYLLLAIPAMAVFSYVGLFEINSSEMCVVLTVSVVGLCSPYVLLKRGVASHSLKYFIMISVSVVIGFLTVYPSIGIYITLILGMLLSLQYFDPELTSFTCVLNYAIMLVCEAFRMYSQYALELGSAGTIKKWLAFCAGYTIEFLVVSPVAISIARATRHHLVTENKLYEALSNEREMYELALDSARDIIYEYNIEKDELKYYGQPLSGNYQPSSDDRHNAVTVEHFLNTIQNGHILHPDDIVLIEGVIQGKQSEPVQVRIEHDGDYDWLEIDSNVLYNDDDAIKIVGKIRNITDAKAEEQAFLQNSERDDVTGFYDRRVGTRIIRQHATEVGRTDNQTFLVVRIINCAEIERRYGEYFMDAIILRVSDILRDEMSDMDLPIRFSRTEFVLYLANRNAQMMEKMVKRMLQEASCVYAGDDFPDGVALSFDSYPTLASVELIMDERDDEKEAAEVTDSTEYRSDMISFAFNILESTKDIDCAVKILLDRVGCKYRLEYVRIFRKKSGSDMVRCEYEWLSSYSEDDIKPLLGTDAGLALIVQEEDILLVDCPAMGEDGGFFIFKKSRFTAYADNETAKVLEEMSQVISTFIGKSFADSANRAKSDFLSSMSHELRTPMNAVAGFAELILQENAGEQVSRYAGNIKNSANNLLGIINDILDLSKLEAGKFEIIPDKYYVHEIVADVFNIINIQLIGSAVKLVTKFGDNLPDGLIGDGMRIRQILINTLNNSYKFTKEGEIGLELTWDGNEENGVLKGVVWDTGIGIKEEEIDKIFSAYGQADTKNNKGIRGTGLGLAITRELIELMDGKIQVESVYGEGTKMIFTIPQKVFDAAVYDYSDIDTMPVSAETIVEFTAPDAKLLIVDDNRVNLEVAAGLIGKYGTAVVTAESGSEALAILEKESDFDLIFMDHLMPDMDGIETTQAIRGSGNPSLEKVPVIALTANAQKGVREVFKAAGMNGYLSKPINLKELAEAMDKYIPDNKKRK